MVDTIISGAATYPNIPLDPTPGITGLGFTTDASSLPASAEGVAARVLTTSGSAVISVAGGSAAVSGTGIVVATWDAHTADGLITAKLTAVGAGAGSLAFRVVDANNYFTLLLRQSAGTLRLVLGKYVAGTLTTLGTTPTGTLSASGDIYQIVLAGSSIIVRKNGVEIFNVTDAAYVNTTHHGLRGNPNSADSTWDYFTLVP